MENNKEHVENRFASVPITSKEMIILAAIGILLLALALYFLPWPTYIEFRVTGAEVDFQGNIISEGDFVLVAWYFDYLFQDDRISMEYLEMPNIEIVDVIDFDNGLPYIQPYHQDPDRLYGMIALEVPHSNGKEGWTETKFIVIYTTTDFSYFLINYMDGNRFFIGVDQDTPNYAEILDQCRLQKD